MMHARALVIVVLLVSYGAVSARQPAVRGAVALPIPAEEIANALDIPSIERSRFVLDVVRTLFTMGLIEGDTRQRENLRAALLVAAPKPGETVPLPLDVSIWRETLLERQVPDNEIIGAILSDRSTALLYHGLAGLDDETLAWLGPERDTLRHLLRHAGAFAAFGPSVRVHAGRIIVPGGIDAEPLWQAIVGADPAKPAAFVRRLFSDTAGVLAWFYDAMTHLDEPRLRFATSASLPPAARIERVRALLDVFERLGQEWQPEKQPFSRRPLDPVLTLTNLKINADGTFAGPVERGLWERVFSESSRVQGPSSARDASALDPTPIDPAWLLSRIHRTPIDVGRRRLETVLFAQRVFQESRADASVASALRGREAFPPLMMTLERAGVTTAGTMAAAAARAEGLTAIGDDQNRALALTLFQGSLGLLDRIARSGSVSRADADGLVARLVAIEHATRGYGARIAAWVQRDLLVKLPVSNGESADALEDTLLAAMAGVVTSNTPDRVVEWEGRRYRVNSARAEMLRLHRIRQRQGGPTLATALERAHQGQKPGGDRVLADTLTSILYAAYLGDPQGPALSGGNVALRHEVVGSGVVGPRVAWRLPTEEHSSKGWRITGSLLGLDVALARMALRRLDSSVMPREPRMVSSERQTAALTVALLSPRALTDTGRDEIAAALARGRARLDALEASNAGAIDQVARDAGLSPWRREALRWTMIHDNQLRDSQLSLVELFWLGRPRATAALSLDGWGAASLPLTGCLCLAMPPAQPWEQLAGRPSVGLLGTRGADVSIKVADTLAALDLPAEIAPGIIAFAMLEVIDQASPAHLDDWSGFTRAALALPRNTLVDYIAAQTAGGPLLPATRPDDRHP
jgi:hypothetical protein